MERTARASADPAAFVDGAEPQCLLDADGHVTRTNRAWDRTFERDAAPMLGRRFDDLFHGADREAAAVALARWRDGDAGHRFLAEARFDDPATTWRYVATPLPDGWHVIGHDVTDLATAERQLRTSERALREATAMAALGRWELDHRTGVLDWSPEVFDLFGRDPATFEPSYEAFLDCIHPDDRAFVADAYAAALADHRAYDVEHRVVLPDGSVRWMREACQLEFDRAGKPLRAVGIVQDVTDRRAHDALTGAASFDRLRARLEDAVLEARTAGTLGAVAALDLDHFAALNDRLGRAGADRVLQRVAGRIAASLRAHDLIARRSGDEFLLLFTRLHRPDEADAAVRRVLRLVTEPLDVGDVEPLRLTASAGVAFFPTPTGSADTLLRHAEQAMLLAKESGRDRVVRFDDEGERRAHELAQRRGSLRAAFEAGQFELHYQPVVDLADGAVAGAEALLRWRHPDEGLLGPGRVLPDLEGDPLELDVGRWVIDEALAAWSRWRAQGGPMAPDACISVNVAAQHLLHPAFLADLRAALRRHASVPPGELQIEVVEATALGDVERARDVLGRCRGLGVRVALDDFGTGYASLAYFRNLPIDVLKVDQSFVHDMLDVPDDLGIVRSVLALANAFNRKVVAEGVETFAHAAALTQLGARLAQGYAFARPMPEAELPTWAAVWAGDRPLRRLGRHLEVAAEDLPAWVVHRSHRRWVEEMHRLVDAPRERPAPPIDRRGCAFGAWYYGIGGAEYGARPGYRALEGLHDDLHAVAAHLVRALDEGRDGDARAHLQELDAAHQALEAGLRDLFGS